jgi:uncharacterized membrane protein YGL010W
MRAVDRYFGDYGSYHRDPRNEATHAIGVPMIVLAIVMWAAKLRLVEVGGVTIDLAWVLVAAAAAFYVALSPRLGLVMAALLVACYLVGARLLGANGWVALALFAVGWVVQFVGHHYEGKRPAFTRNAVHLLVGPLWILDRGLDRLR